MVDLLHGPRPDGEHIFDETNQYIRRLKAGTGLNLSVDPDGQLVCSAKQSPVWISTISMADIMGTLGTATMQTGQMIPEFDSGFTMFTNSSFQYINFPTTATSYIYAIVRTLPPNLSSYQQVRVLIRYGYIGTSNSEAVTVNMAFITKSFPNDALVEFPGSFTLPKNTTGGSQDCFDAYVNFGTPALVANLEGYLRSSLLRLLITNNVPQISLHVLGISLVFE